MKNISFPLKNSVYIRIIVTFIFILIPILAVGMGIYYNGIQSINNGIGSLTQTQNDSYLGNFENEIKRIQSLQYDLYNDENLLFLTIPSTSLDYYNRDKGLLRLQQRLYTIKSSSRFIEEVKVYLPSQHLLITPTTNSNTYSNTSVLISMFPKPSLNQINYWNGKLILAGFYPMKSQSNYTNSLFAIEIDLSSSEIRKMLLENSTYNGAGSFLFSEDLNFIFSNSIDTSLSKEIKNKMLLLTKKEKTAENQMSSSYGKLLPIKIDNSKYVTIFSTSKYLGVTLVSYIPENEILSKAIQFRKWIWFLTLTSFIMLPIFSFSLFRFIHRPLNNLAGAFRKVKKGNLDVRIKHEHKDEFKYIYESFNEMVENLNTLIEQSYKNKILAQKAELKQLQSQINPHFLYNSFFILQKRIKYGDNENALIFAEQLGTFFQFITRSAGDEVTLFKEVEHARIYAEIQGTRFSKRIKVEFDELPKEWHNIVVPRIILQPLIENSFEHSLESMSQNGKLTISFEESKAMIFISVENNGEELSSSKLQSLRDKLSNDSDINEITGMVNIHKRLKLKFGDESGISLYHGSNGGLRSTLAIKKEVTQNGI